LKHEALASKAQGLLCYADLVLEYFSLMSQAKREDLPLNHRKGIMEVLSNMRLYMTPEQHQEYLIIAQEIREKMQRVSTLN
jgi:hypothetical protein